MPVLPGWLTDGLAPPTVGPKIAQSADVDSREEGGAEEEEEVTEEEGEFMVYIEEPVALGRTEYWMEIGRREEGVRPSWRMDVGMGISVGGKVGKKSWKYNSQSFLGLWGGGGERAGKGGERAG